MLGPLFDRVLIPLGFLRKRLRFRHTGLTTVLTTLILGAFQIIFLGQNVTPWLLPFRLLQWAERFDWHLDGH
jgi:hypothetical protein